MIFHYFGTKILYFTGKKYQKSKIFSIEILLRMICQKLMSNDACNFVILYMVCKIELTEYFTKTIGQKWSNS